MADVIVLEPDQRCSGCGKHVVSVRPRNPISGTRKVWVNCSTCGAINVRDVGSRRLRAFCTRKDKADLAAAQHLDQIRASHDETVARLIG